MNIAERMLICGTEVGRVEDSISRICRAYGALRVDALTITSSIIVTIETPEGECLTQTRRIEERSNDLMRIEALNRLSREICETRPTVEHIEKRLAEIDGMKRMRWYVAALAALLVASTFTVFFGGSWRDALASTFAAAAIFGFDRLARGIKPNRIVYNLFVSLVTGAVCVATVRLGIGQNLDYIMIGAIMLLIPGMAMTAAVEDLLVGDTITGLLQLCESLITACAIAAGFAVATYVCGATELVNMVGAGQTNKILQLAMALFTAFGFALKLGLKRPSRLIASAVGGLLGWLGYLVAIWLGCDDFAACFIAAAVGAIYSQVMARVLRAPAPVFLVPAVIPLVPGRALFYTMSSALIGSSELMESWGKTTALEALAIALGMVAVLIAAGGIIAINRRIKLRKSGHR